MPARPSISPALDHVLYFAIHMMGISSIMGAINVIATILNLRAPGMTLMKMPLFVWPLITAYLLIAVMPVLAGVVTMMLMDIHFGTPFFTGGGGDPVLFQHVFWFFGHPEVYIMILPAFGVVSRSSRPLPVSCCLVHVDGLCRGKYRLPVVYRLGTPYVTVGIPLVGEVFFMYATMLIAVPTGVKVFNWVATMFRGADL